MRSTTEPELNGSTELMLKRNIAALALGMEAQSKALTGLHDRIGILENENATRAGEFQALRAQLAALMGKVGNIGPTG